MDNQIQNRKTNFKDVSLGILSTLSFYAPLIITISVFISSIFTSSLSKGLYYLFWIFVITMIRILIMYYTNSNILYSIPEHCKVGSILPYSTPTYSTFILSFTLFYLLIPMIMISNKLKIDAINYIVVFFLITYIVADILIKNTLGCLGRTFMGTTIGEILGGITLGSLISSITFATSLRNMLFISGTSSNREICNMPSKQQFKCRVFKNGELVGTSIN
jgi:hypothetical protein